ncbi:betaine-aldehyde dehydrogenase [Sinorhizobium meliloti]|uniref:betaine-aldehyde dehydrogenase n=1 Tax=Rhizobium meliloti TaxID=382 RepID=UPI000FDB1B3E|nr:betaine-aldehyde dehydrogenase [Sinorhizobium meliloti]MDW9428580.1 betaine-aldehyde dehydrogenase [Sinorhizobium meliloti]MDW9507451.1 betaine-aldehyde dehydrogenase [Sinorhizobium meliloti]MDW9539230.1 betaine-aldehyde dehydrogenase [Sinorhizobium meliloti]MDW9799477.1 betaine-aldehyde dehydrogenase [Sinorhizobium meliloti]MDX0016844.1 betaine-aldehyde dehydrogenase [Sinorhizobium meliloti]
MQSYQIREMATPLCQPAASHFIDGTFMEDRTGPEILSVNPVDGEIIAKLHGATSCIIEKAIASAKRAQKEWARKEPAERGRVLSRAADIMRARNRELSVLETRDTGKPISETLVADAASGADCLEYFGAIAATLSGDSIQFGEDWVYTRREPLGVCLGIGAWNYPIQIAAWKAAPALACGNAMIFKPSEVTPLSALKLAEILTEAGLPPGVFNIVQGAGDVGAELATHPAIAKVSLTGSVKTGARVASAAMAGIRPVTMELGGKSALIVFDDADVEAAVSGAILGNFYSAGQICSNGTRVFLQRGIREAFLARLLARVAALKIGDPMDEETDIGPLVSAAHRNRVATYVARAEVEGAYQMTPPRKLPPGDAWHEPVVFTNVTDWMTLAREEVFGPVMAVLDFDDEQDVVARANATDFGLAAGIFTRDLVRAHGLAAELEAGTVWINAYNLTPAGMAFGGIKRSGIGRENGRVAIDHYTQLKSVFVSMQT